MSKSLNLTPVGEPVTVDGMWVPGNVLQKLKSLILSCVKSK